MANLQSGLNLYLSRQASSTPRYIWEQLILSLFGWIPTVVGIGIRSIFYRSIMKLDGTVAIERGVRIRFADQVSLAAGVYLDEGVYLHACPGGIDIGDGHIVRNSGAPLAIRKAAQYVIGLGKEHI